MVNIHHIVILLELLNEFLNSLASLSIEFFGVGWDAYALSRDNLVTLVIKPLLDSAERLVCSVNGDTVLLSIELINAQVNHLKLELLWVNTLSSLKLEYALVLEHKCHAT